MAFFPRKLYNAETSFTPLFRLLDDFEDYSRQSCGPTHHGRRSALPTWQPKFDIRETGDNYELHGELPGMSKENVNIEFTDNQTMLVRGKVERTYTAGTPPDAAGQVEDTAMSGGITEGEESKTTHNATVEDEDETDSSKDSATEVDEKKESKPADKAKYWLSERSIGEFSRSFYFPARVDQDAVSATIQDGVLTIIAPKVKRHESRRIAIN
ncbi:hypothetical protein DCS_07438 [Drechmeria coniospora]|uniref:SHSP domain-containing protein n=1 Tax=Drechmeria coniospora TaxID=98403 RepID=A0A151GEF9_DRECN|nr:hypothetical protein DCS_07438 [Drechmeria coniospora]KYK55475.1 hypothetical protein DCS_07438 [Drechmeria coniospora]ODA81918.1 hypothetical protein RJ55_00423 [Drechmeria coniospora]